MKKKRKETFPRLYVINFLCWPVFRLVSFSFPFLKHHCTSFIKRFHACQYSHAVSKSDPEKNSLFSSLFYMAASGHIQPRTHSCCLLTFQSQLTCFWFNFSRSFVENSEMTMIVELVFLVCLKLVSES